MDDLSQLIPPKELLFVGEGGNFLVDGQNQLNLLVNVGGLKPHHRVLDIGCGVGRVAVPLTRYLSPVGSYEGMDIVPVGIDWCRNHITPRFPRFRFQVADVFSRGYNPAGRYEASEYRFPHADGEFDFIFLFSVFTHMIPPDMENYLAEISRLLKPGGRCLITYFLRNAEMERLRDAGRSMYRFEHRRLGCWVENPAVPEDATCHNETDVLALYERYGLSPEGSIHYGAWSGRTPALSGQDLVVASKVRSVQVKSRPSMGLVRWMRWLLRAPYRRFGWRSAARNVVGRANKYASEHEEAA